ncbi:MAG TPA: hypothetical protein PK264_09815 [Hyphomicrobiaceae bacterium]|nr:hypothetical protein [Hyphomicrobiaceae bacterium]
MPQANQIVLDSVTHLTDAHRGKAALCASHGGHYAAYYGATKAVSALILNDAGVGRERVGFSGSIYLERLGLPAATISSQSARIGDGRDGHANGIISFVNAPAAKLKLKVGMRCREALDMLATAGLPPSPPPPAEDEHRTEIVDAGRGKTRVIAMDSISLVATTDRQNIVVTGSHGGLLGGRKETAIKFPVAGVVCNDAGFGRDNAGMSRLPVLDALGIPAACVSNFSARIGDGMSTYRDGYVSALNEAAKKAGGLIGQSCRELVALIVASAPSP